MSRHRRRYVGHNRRHEITPLEAAADYGPAERAHQRGGLAVVPRSQTEAGIVLAHGAYAIGENLLRLLYVAGALRTEAETDHAPARRRFDAGQDLFDTWWRSELRLRMPSCIHERSGDSPKLPPDGLLPRNLRFWLALDSCGPQRDVVWRVICLDIAPNPSELPQLIVALDRCADYFDCRRESAALTLPVTSNHRRRTLRPSRATARSDIA